MLSNRCIFPADMLQLIALGNTWPHGQAVKTLPSHGKNWGSIPHGATKRKHVDECQRVFFWCLSGERRGMPFMPRFVNLSQTNFCGGLPLAGNRNFPFLLVCEVGVFFMPAPQGNAAACPLCRGSSICRRQIFNSSPDYRRYTVRIIMPVISGSRRLVLAVIITGCLF